MELRNLRALVEVARSGGFSAAAKVLGTTQSTVSKAVRQLEHDCGTALIERLGRGIRLTAAGEIAVRRAANMLAEQEHLVSEIGELRGMERGKLRLGLPVLASSLVFADWVAAFRKKYPQIEVELHERAARVLEEEVRHGLIETGASLLPVPDDFDYRLIRQDKILALVPPDHALAGRKSARLKELAPYPVIMFEEGFALNSIIASGFRKQRLTLIDGGRSGNPDFIIAMVAAGLGIAFVPNVVVLSRRELSVHPIEISTDEMIWELALIWRRGASLSPAALRWLELVAPIPKRNS